MTVQSNPSQDAHQIRKNKMLSLALVPVFTVLMIISAQIRIPVSVIVITLQLTVAILSGLLLGARLGFLSQVLYILMGLMGLPVFAGGGGIGYVTVISFGYIIGFAFCALVGGYLADQMDKRATNTKGFAHYLGIVGISLVSLFVCYLFGMTYMYLLTNFYTGSAVSKMGINAILMANLLPLAKDVVLCLLASELARRLWRFRYRDVRTR
jgi:biotin transport system substrate-specific component